MQTPPPSYPVVTPVPLASAMTGHSLPLGELLWGNQFKSVEVSTEDENDLKECV